jgi:hypothetical protein
MDYPRCKLQGSPVFLHRTVDEDHPGNKGEKSRENKKMLWRKPFFVLWRNHLKIFDVPGGFTPATGVSLGCDNDVLPASCFGNIAMRHRRGPGWRTGGDTRPEKRIFKRAHFSTDVTLWSHQSPGGGRGSEERPPEVNWSLSRMWRMPEGREKSLSERAREC